MLNVGGTERSHGKGYLFGPAGRRGSRVRGYSNLPKMDFEKIWFGFGFKWSGHLAVGGAEYMIGGLTNPMKRTTTIIQTQGFKAGPGPGGSYSFVGILALGYPTAQAMKHATNDGFDFALSVGEKWDGILKCLKKCPGLRPSLQKSAESSQSYRGG